MAERRDNKQARSRIRKRAHDPGRVLFGRRYYVPVLTGERVETRRAEGPVPRAPEQWHAQGGTEPEWAIYWAHLVAGLEDGKDFVYRMNRGAADGMPEIDFFEIDLNLGLNIQGTFYHQTGSSLRRLRSDRETRIELEALGIATIYIDEFDALRDPHYYLSEALRGRDHSAQAGF